MPTSGVTSWPVARMELSWWIGLDRALDGALSRHLAPTGAKMSPTPCRDATGDPPMPAPHHLLPILAVLGDGGTADTAEAVAAAAGGLPGQVPAPTVEAVMGALGDRATVDVAEALVGLYSPATTTAITGTFTVPGPIDAVITVSPMPGAQVVGHDSAGNAVYVAPETPQDDAGDTDTEPPAEDEGAALVDDSDPQDDDGIDWDDAPTDTEPAPDATAPETDAAPPVPAPSAADIRAWAKAEGIKVSIGGAIPRAVRDAYTQAHA